MAFQLYKDMCCKRIIPNMTFHQVDLSAASPHIHCISWVDKVVETSHFGLEVKMQTWMLLKLMFFGMFMNLPLAM